MASGYPPPHGMPGGPPRLPLQPPPGGYPPPMQPPQHSGIAPGGHPPQFHQVPPGHPPGSIPPGGPPAPYPGQVPQMGMARYPMSMAPPHSFAPPMQMMTQVPSQQPAALMPTPSMQPQITAHQMGGAQTQYAPPTMAPSPGAVYHQPGVQMSAPPVSVPATSMYGSGPTRQQPLLQTSSTTAPNMAPSGPVPMAMGMGVASAAGGVASTPGGVVTAPASSSTVASVPSVPTAAVVSGTTAAAGGGGGGGGGVSTTPSPGPERKKKKKKEKKPATAWTEHKAPDGRLYYYNNDTKKCLLGRSLMS